MLVLFGQCGRKHLPSQWVLVLSKRMHHHGYSGSIDYSSKAVISRAWLHLLRGWRDLRSIFALPPSVKRVEKNDWPSSTALVRTKIRPPEDAFVNCQ